MEELVPLAGVGRKTANVVLGNAFDVPGIPVDTHVGRLSQRMGLTIHNDPVKIESDLMAVDPQKEWTTFGHRMIYHGRQVCHARKPWCEQCTLAPLCPKIGVAVGGSAEETAKPPAAHHESEASMTNTLLDRFCRYVRVDTTADENSTTYPSTPGQLELGRMLTEELRAMGLRDAVQDEFGIVLATIPATVTHTAPHRLDRPCRYLAGDDRPQRQAARFTPTTTAATSSCPAIRAR